MVAIAVGTLATIPKGLDKQMEQVEIEWFGFFV